MESELTAEQQLARFFRSHGHLRLPDWKRQSSEGPQSYKKGYEARLIASSEEELQEIRSLLERAGFKVANSHVKGNQWIQPIYGRAAVQRVCRLSGRETEIEPIQKPEQSTVVDDTTSDGSGPEQFRGAPEQFRGAPAYDARARKARARGARRLHRLMRARGARTWRDAQAADLAEVEFTIGLWLQVFTGQSHITLSTEKCEIVLALARHESQ